MPKCHFKIQGQIFLVFQKDDEEPKSIFEALSCTVKKNQKIAMAEEIESIKSNQIWDLVDLSIGRKAIWNKQVLQIKQKANGTIERYKVGLQQRIITQQEGINYGKNIYISPVVKFTLIRILLAIVARLNLELHQ